ncbi:MAG: Na+/H+ antiporter subunit E [Candidatus Altiarchaeales archaeon]|nr:Na+/H+ antiporter subunit E [Candidatus Altiarchaeales archaeon]
MTHGKNSIPRFLATFIIMFVFWISLSWILKPLHLMLGLISSFLVAYLSSDLLISRKNVGFPVKKIILFILYLPYLIYCIVLANLDVAYRVLHPKMPINPRIVKFKSRLKSDLGQMMLGNSITLTPGTITVDIKEGVFYVHALSESSAQDLLKGKMEDKLVKIFEGG